METAIAADWRIGVAGDTKAVAASREVKRRVFFSRKPGLKIPEPAGAQEQRLSLALRPPSRSKAYPNSLPTNACRRRGARQFRHRRPGQARGEPRRPWTSRREILRQW